MTGLCFKLFRFVSIDSVLPSGFHLGQNYPHPFNPSTTIRYGLPEEVKVSLVIYDVRGQVIQSINQLVGTEGTIEASSWNQ